MTLHLLDPEAALGAAKRQSKSGPPFPLRGTPPTRSGWCAVDVRECYGAPSSGDADHDGDADAVDVFYRAAKADRHRVTLDDLRGGYRLPRGVPFLFSGGSHGNGHATITTGRGRGLGSFLLSPDTRRAGYFDRVTVAEVLGWMSHSAPLGWVGSIGGQRIDLRSIAIRPPAGPR